MLVPCQLYHINGVIKQLVGLVLYPFQQLGISVYTSAIFTLMRVLCQVLSIKLVSILRGCFIVPLMLLRDVVFSYEAPSNYSGDKSPSKKSLLCKSQPSATLRGRFIFLLRCDVSGKGIHLLEHHCAFHPASPYLFRVSTIIRERYHAMKNSLNRNLRSVYTLSVFGRIIHNK